MMVLIVSAVIINALASNFHDFAHRLEERLDCTSPHQHRVLFTGGRALSQQQVCQEVVAKFSELLEAQG